MKMYRDYQRRVLKYFSKYPNYNSFVHAIAGIGVGFLLAYPVAGAHPIRWGIGFLLLSIAGHVWAGQKMK